MFRILGPVEVWWGGRRLDVGAAKQRFVLAVLALEVNHVVPLDRLISLTWADDPPPAAAKTIQAHVSRLRTVLKTAAAETDGVALVSERTGYELRADPMSVDAHRFRALVEQARHTDDEHAITLLREALDLWRGEALAGTAPDEVRYRLCHGLDEARLVAVEDRVDAELRLGRHREVLGELTGLVTAHPTRERLVGQHMLALHRSGRASEALEAYRHFRTRLGEELGLDPGTALQHLESAILRADPSLELPPRSARTAVTTNRVAVPRQLPTDIASFASRSRYLQELDALLPRDDDAVPRAVVLSAIAGTAGIGKTALAVHWAHRVADRFPDGQLHVNLRGFDPQAPVEAGQALHGFLLALGVDPQAIPIDLEAKAALYRSLLAGKRMLIVLDNARDTEHVRPLLPASPTCLAIITSRNRLDSLTARHGAHRLTLDFLSTDEAVALLTTRLGRQRVAAEPDAVAELIELCIRLPLALSIAAARATTQPTLTLSRLAEDLRDERARLDVLDTGDIDLDLRAVFSWSYHTLTAQAARLFRLLGVQPGPDISLPAAANLTDIHIRSAHGLLTELTRAHLLDEHTPGRFRFHDLLRAYAGEQAVEGEPETQRRAAIHRLLDYYLHTSLAAACCIDPHREPITLDAPQPGVTPGAITDHEQAVRWFTAEHTTLLAATARAARAGFDVHAWQLPRTLGTFLDLQGHWHDDEDAGQTALAAARRLGDRAAQATTHRGLGWTYTRLGRYADALTHLRRALVLFRELGDHAGQAHTHHCLGFVYEQQGRYTEALIQAQHALDLSRATGDHAAQAWALNALGWAHAELGNFQQALTHCHHALRLLRDLHNRDRDGEADTLDSLGYAHHHLGHHTQAIAHYQQALALYRELGNRYDEAETLTHLGDTHHVTGNQAAAQEAWRQALVILDQLGHPDADQVRTKLTQLDPEPEANASHGHDSAE
ncbi:AfsR/SARP family transcriptional regulator [Kibdelosporangium aridum]|uniref:DNA-binding transcriptional activator of the SARP family n=1 Tax=Kibdelosporangium aridum TaxID=2030 RepID=A0A1W2G0E8_KIBAR|nr:BTAD domain-containing putative transcriptional regulator [Kibdelosporangium aridum]SMD27504.1 DNA-binding transcriptional activator of the SARP family [Kibdelosporangium aridum]